MEFPFISLIGTEFFQGQPGRGVTMSLNNQSFPPRNKKMERKSMADKIHIAPSGIINAGRGVFASRNIKANEIIEVCPILILWDKDTVLVMKTMLQNYVFEYEKDSALMALGYGSLYNNNAKPNAKYELQEYEGSLAQDSELVITAIRPIAKNEEIFIDYGIQDYLKTLKQSS